MPFNSNAFLGNLQPLKRLKTENSIKTKTKNSTRQKNTKGKENKPSGEQKGRKGCLSSSPKTWANSQVLKTLENTSRVEAI